MGACNIYKITNVTILRSKYIENTSTTRVGVLLLQKIDNLLIESVLMDGNKSYLNGMMIQVEHSENIQIKNSNFTNSSPYDNGDLVLAFGGLNFGIVSNLHITNCLFHNNRANTAPCKKTILLLL